VEIWLAVLAVVGTLGGAAIGPVNIARQARRAEAAARVQARVTAASEFSAALVDLALLPADDRIANFLKARSDAYRTRIQLSGTVGVGDGRVDDFTAYAIGHVDSELMDAEERVFLANHAARRVLEWARGERKATTLVPFRMVGDTLDRRVRESSWGEEAIADLAEDGELHGREPSGSGTYRVRWPGSPDCSRASASASENAMMADSVGEVIASGASSRENEMRCRQ